MQHLLCSQLTGNHLKLALALVKIDYNKLRGDGRGMTPYEIELVQNKYRSTHPGFE